MKRESITERLDAETAVRFAALALACIHREYPNKISHCMNSDADAAPPRQLTPAFYGCYDWHSAVHGHWLLVRLARLFPEAPFSQAARQALARNLTTENLRREADYVGREGRDSFERPYGLAWLMQLAAELHEWNDGEAHAWSANLLPLEQMVRERLTLWLKKLPHAVRSGEHSQTAFAMGLMLDYARIKRDGDFAELLAHKAKQFFLADKNSPLAYEPSGEDFLSPCLGEADLMRRVLQAEDYSRWLSDFMPQISTSGDGGWLVPEVSPDRADGKLAHLDGLNLSRAWMLLGIASGLPAGDKRIDTLRASSALHRSAGLEAVTGEHYEGGHWLGSFAVYLLTRRGILQAS